MALQNNYKSKKSFIKKDKLEYLNDVLISVYMKIILAASAKQYNIKLSSRRELKRVKNPTFRVTINIRRQAINWEKLSRFDLKWFYLWAISFKCFR